MYVKPYNNRHTSYGTCKYLLKMIRIIRSRGDRQRIIQFITIRRFIIIGTLLHRYYTVHIYSMSTYHTKHYYYYTYPNYKRFDGTRQVRVYTYSNVRVVSVLYYCFVMLTSRYLCYNIHIMSTRQGHLLFFLQSSSGKATTTTVVTGDLTSCL